MDVLTEHQRAIADRVVVEEEARRRHIVIALSGAHAYGFPSPDSDLDLKSVHIESTKNLLGLGTCKDAHDRLEVVDGIEIDYTSNELRGVLAGIIAGNGNYLERILGSLIVHSSPEHQQLKALVPGVLSQRVHRHYRGFAGSQRKAFEEAEQPTAKKLLYVLRTALTGTHLLRTGELRVDLTTIASDYGYADALDLVEAKKQGERTVLAPGDRQAWIPRLDALFALLDSSLDKSPLPVHPSTRDLEAWLLETRMSPRNLDIEKAST